jgi:hypothetical protein
MLIETGEKVHVIIRRTFETDLRRHFIGEIMAVADSCVRVKGFFMVFDRNKNSFTKKLNQRLTILDLSSSGYWVNLIPKDVNISDLIYAYDNNKNLILTDEKSFKLDINEFGVHR